MLDIVYTSKFKKDIKLIKKRGKNLDKLYDIVGKIASGNKLDEKHNNHTLTGDYKGFSECHIEPDWLLVYLINNDCLVLTLARTGSHSDLF